MPTYLNKCLEEYADANNLQISHSEIDYIIRLARLSDKAKSAFLHLQNEMLDKILK